MISADIEALYTNINLDLAIDIITDFAKDKFNIITDFAKDKFDLNITAFNVILKLIFENNIFTYADNYYKQILGIAMGSVCGPTIANIFVNHFEKRWLSIAKPLYYKRFIDDLFIIYIDDNSFDFAFFNSSFLPLKLTFECGTRLNFLDLEISYEKFLRKVTFKIFFKKTNTFSYLLTSSNHPKRIFDNFPKSIFYRVKKNCTYESDYFYFSTIVMKQLLLCGYDYKFLIKVLNTVDKIERDTLIPYRNKKINNFCDNNTILFKLPYDCNIIHNKNKLNEVKAFFDENYNFDVKVKFFNSVQNNLGSLLIHNFKIPKIEVFKNTVCIKQNCEICKFISFDESLILNNGFQLPLLCKGNCESKMALYIIKCLLCNELYIGKTENTIKKRMQVHFSMIRNFFPFKYKCKSDIEHFNLINHNYEEHLKFYVF